MKKNHYSQEIKKKAVEQILAKEKTQVQVAEELKVSKNTVYTWIKSYQYKTGWAGKILIDNHAPSFATLEDISKLEAEVETLKEENKRIMQVYLQKEASERRFHEFKLLLTNLLNLENTRS